MSDLPDKEPQRLSETGDFARLLTAARDASANERTGSRERIWEGVVNANTPSRARWLIPAFAGAFAATVLVLLLRAEAPLPSPTGPEPFATLALTAGDVQASSADATWSAAQVGEQLVEGSRLRTAGNSRAYARFASAGALFSEGTRATFTRDRKVIAVKLDEGAMTFSVRNGTGGVIVNAEAYAIEVTGTVFQVKVGSEHIVDVFVHEGTVRVRGPSTDLSLRAGESWSSRTGTGSGTIDPLDVKAARGLADASGKEATLRISGPAGAAITVDGVLVGSAPLSVLQGVGSHEVMAELRGARISGRTDVGAQGAVFELAAQPLPALAPPAEKPQSLQPGEADAAAPLQQKLEGKLPAAERDTATYDLARLLSRRGRHAEALALYERLAAGTGAWSEPSLYEVGRLKLRYLADPAGSVSAFADYRRRHPRGALAHEVALSSIEAQLARGASSEALRELDAFLATFPSSERLEDVRFIRATVRRDRGDCDGARVDYLQLHHSARHGDDALYFTAYCEQQRGNAAEARRHLAEYVLKFPAGRHLAEARAALGR